MKNFAEFILENDNLNRSYKGASKFGIVQDPDKKFIPDFLSRTRLEISKIILESGFEEFGDYEDFDDLSDESQSKAINDFCQLLTDEDCQNFVEGESAFHRVELSEDDIMGYDKEIAIDIISNKKFNFKSYVH